MKNEFESLTNTQVFKMYKKSSIAWRQSSCAMPYNDREYLLQRAVALRKECVRRGLL